MYVRRIVYGIVCVAALVALGWRSNLAADGQAASARETASGAEGEQHYLYVAVPGIRNYIEYGGVGVLVYDMTNGHRLVKRIPTFDPASDEGKENVKGNAADAAAGRLYVATIKRVVAIDVASERIVWNRAYEGGADRLAISPDGKLLYVPSLEGPHWHAVNAATGDVVASVVTKTGAHNTIYGADGREVYLAGLRSPNLLIADPQTHTVVRSVGPFSSVIRPFTINGAQTLCFVNVNDLLGFEVGDLKTGKMLHRVEVAGYEKGPIKRHGCPSHGVGLTPDEKELWLTDAANSSMHVFDATVMPPKQVSSIKLRDQPGWITFSLDGRYAYPSTGEVIDTASKRVVATLSDETGRAVQSEKVVEIVFKDGRPVRHGDQFGVGRRP
jgi:DNA-binding beta-propeller fold protein YncE